MALHSIQLWTLSVTVSHCVCVTMSLHQNMNFIFSCVMMSQSISYSWGDCFSICCTFISRVWIPSAAELIRCLYWAARCSPLRSAMHMASLNNTVSKLSSSTIWSETHNEFGMLIGNLNPHYLTLHFIQYFMSYSSPTCNMLFP